MYCLPYSALGILCGMFATSFAWSDDSPTPEHQVAQQVLLQIDNGESGAKQDVNVRFWLYLPTGYDSQIEASPLLLFLHGAGERGDDLNRVKLHGPPKLISDGRSLPFVVVSPQHPGTRHWSKDPWSVETLSALLDHIDAKYNVDKCRFYVTGLSMGGYGTWRLVAAHPGRFAAAAPICGGGDDEHVEQLKNLPIWAFHGEDDETVPFSDGKKMVDAVNAAGGNAKLTAYPGIGHDSWTRTYENPKLYDWFLEHRR